MAIEQPLVPTGAEGKELQEPEQSRVYQTHSRAKSPRIFGHRCPWAQHKPRRAGRVGVSVAGQEVEQGSACTNSPWKGISTCSRARGEGPSLMESGANWGQRAEQGRAQSTLGAGRRIWPLATMSWCSSMLTLHINLSCPHGGKSRSSGPVVTFSSRMQLMAVGNRKDLKYI